jgi:stage II sporulation protein D
LDWKGEATPYLTNVKDVAGSEGFSPWTASFTKADIRSAVIRVTGTDPGSFTSIGITKRGPSGRAMALVMGGAAVSGPQLRIALGSEKLKSTLIDQISVLGENVTFSGRGFGHGVGMAQDGARALATQGRKAADIVRFYYRSVQVVTRWR